MTSVSAIIPIGYKQTEVGVIPEDWVLIKLGSFGAFSKGRGITKSEANSGHIPSIRYGEIYTYHDDVVRSYNSHISSQVAESSKMLRKGDILFAGSGETREEIGKCVVFIDEIEAYAGGDVVIFSPRSENSTYLAYTLNSFQVSQQKSKLGQGDAVVHIYSSELSGVLIPIPPSEEEQKIIADIITDSDSQIQALENLISKKRNLKKGTMQKLLTGRARLPGFTEKWILKRVSNFGTIVTGSTPLTHKPEFWGGNIPWITPTDITNRSEIFTSERQITIEGLDSIRILPENSVLVTCIASIGKNIILRKLGSCNQQINAIIPNQKYSTEFLYFLFENNKSFMIGNAGITATMIISKTDFEKFTFLVPNSLEEQQAIAEILSDMDAEIFTLEQRLEKTKAIKQGMMQQLLTGRIRLVDPSTPVEASA